MFGDFYQSCSRKEMKDGSLSIEGRCFESLGIRGREEMGLGWDGWGRGFGLGVEDRMG